LNFGLGVRTGIDIPNESQGIWPSREWKRAKRKEAWYPGDSVNLGIGQGYVSVTPLQLGVMVATIASRGKRYRPRLAKAIDGVEIPPVLESHLDVKKEYWDAVFDGMLVAVYGPGGTLTRYHLELGADYRIAGKSGTASVVTISQNAKYKEMNLKNSQRDHVLFVGFAPVEDPQIAIAIILENDDHAKASENPSLLARTLFDAQLRGYYRVKGEPIFGFPSAKEAPAAVLTQPAYDSETPNDPAELDGTEPIPPASGNGPDQ